MRRLGFSVDVSSSRLGRVELRFTPGAGEGIVGWSLDGPVPVEIDGLALAFITPAGRGRPADDRLG